jgi:ADP-ribose pyrophosphatase
VAAESLDLLGDFYLAPGYSTELMYVYLAQGLFASPLEGDLDERIEIVILEKWEAYQMVDDGEIRDAKTIAALYLGRGRLGIV